MAGAIHDVATSEIGGMLWKKTASMGPELNKELRDIWGTTYKENSTRKEPNSGFRPQLSCLSETNWPTLIIESGVSETLERLRVDTQWWPDNSLGNVNIVLLFSINDPKQEILIEQWEFSHPQNHPGTGLELHPEKIPTCRVSFTIALGDASAPAASTSVEPSEPDPPNLLLTLQFQLTFPNLLLWHQLTISNTLLWALLTPPQT